MSSKNARENGRQIPIASDSIPSRRIQLLNPAKSLSIQIQPPFYMKPTLHTLTFWNQIQNTMKNAVVKLLKLHMDLLAAHNHWQTKCSNQMIHLRRPHLYYIQKLFTNPKSQATRRNYVATRKLHITDDKSEFTGNKSKHKSHVTSQMT